MLAQSHQIFSTFANGGTIAERQDTSLDALWQGLDPAICTVLRLLRPGILWMAV